MSFADTRPEQLSPEIALAKSAGAPERAQCAPGGLADERVEPGQGSAVLASRARWQLRDRLVGGDREGLDLDQILVELVDQDAGVEVVRGGLFRYLRAGVAMLRHRDS